MPSKNPTIVKAFKDGVISKSQYDKMNDGILLGIIQKKKKSAPKTTKKEVRHKTGSQKGKAGRPKKGSKVVVE